MAKAQHKIWRKNFRDAVFARDEGKCRICNKVGVDAHHICDRSLIVNGGYVLSNGILLCHNCHEKAEVWHSSGHQKWVEGFHPDDLYKIIESSYNQAVEDSENLDFQGRKHEKEEHK